MQHRPCQQRVAPSLKRGFTIVELLVAIVIIGLLISLLLPALSDARGAARRTQCSSNLRQIALAIHDNELSQKRLPAMGNWGHDAAMVGYPLHTWAVTILPQIEQGNLFNQWDRDTSLEDPKNEPLSRTAIPLYACPSDITLTGRGDLSYVVNGGIGYTNKHANGTRDVPVDSLNRSLDLNGDGIFPHDPIQSTTTPTDRDLFKCLGLFFMETWNTEISRRHYQLADIQDGSSQTIMLSENVRAGVDPLLPRSSFANPDPTRCAFYMNDPCVNQTCKSGAVDYKLANSNGARINSGRAVPEGTSPIPNSFHDQGVNIAMADGSVRFLQENVDSIVYAALLSPRGQALTGLPLQQIVVGDEF